MPLKCLNNNQLIYSFNLNDDEWEALRNENKDTKCLETACCHVGVVLKTSPLGTKYFAHARKGECITAPMTAEHILAQLHIIEGIKRTDWIFEPEANPEVSEITPTGREWQADVLATKNKSKVAFEVQWSRQTIKETIRRHDRYKNSKVRALWFFRQDDFISNKGMPAFQIDFDTANKLFKVYLRPIRYWTDDKPKLPFILLQDFVEGCLTGKLIYSPVIGKTIPLEVSTTNIQCKRCKRTTNIITGLNFLVSEVLPNCPNIPANIYTKGIEKWLLEWLPAGLLKAHIIGKLKVRKSFMQVEKEASYFSNGCAHCDGIQPKHFEYRLDNNEEIPLIKLNILFTQELADIFWNDYVHYWWFDRDKSIS